MGQGLEVVFDLAELVAMLTELGLQVQELEEGHHGEEGGDCTEDATHGRWAGIIQLLAHDALDVLEAIADALEVTRDGASGDAERDGRPRENADGHAEHDELGSRHGQRGSTAWHVMKVNEL